VHKCNHSCTSAAQQLHNRKYSPLAAKLPPYVQRIRFQFARLKLLGEAKKAKGFSTGTALRVGAGTGTQSETNCWARFPS
jgi:hypothetical protein